jgi:hypothetical protein
VCTRTLACAHKSNYSMLAQRQAHTRCSHPTSLGATWENSKQVAMAHPKHVGLVTDAADRPQSAGKLKSATMKMSRYISEVLRTIGKQTRCLP